MELGNQRRYLWFERAAAMLVWFDVYVGRQAPSGL
jgi:hypothetical protein